MIKEFSGENRWLSNFYKLEKPLVHQNINYNTVENFFVGMKTEDVVYSNQTEEQEKQGELKTIFKDGVLIRETTLSEIRERVNSNFK